MKEASLEKKTQVYWIMSKAYNQGSNISTGVAINKLRSVENSTYSGRPLAIRTSELLNSIIGIRKGKKVDNSPSLSYIAGNPTGGDVA